MLALTRKAGQSIVIGDQIEITVVEVRGDQVRIAIKAPKEISIYRKEIYTAIQAENVAAADSAKDSLDEMTDIIAKAMKVNK